VQAVTERGGGFWVVTPFDTVDGYTVLINRGFVSPMHRDPVTRPQGQIEGVTTVTGLVRMSESGGAYLRANEPAADRWYSRDVGAIASARGLTDVAPYFIDADASESLNGDAPIGGLTVIAFANNHLQYALTWFALALMVAGGAVLVLRHEWRWRKLPAT
jgi:surfeit locus 1 family protein